MVAVAAGLIAAAIAASPPDGAEPEVRLEQAIHREIVLGDLTGATEQYRAVLAQAGKSRAVAARALLGLGSCLEKSGRHEEAREAFARLLKEYPDQTAVEQARARLAGMPDTEPGPRNLRFESGTPGKVPPGWFVPALPIHASRIAEMRRNGCRSGKGCAVVVAPVNAPSPFGSLMQSFGAASYRGKSVRLRAWLRVEDPEPDDRGQVWLSVDRMSGRNDFLDNRNQRTVQSAEWTVCEIETAIADDATFINFGIMAFGQARVWVDDVSFEVFTGRAR
jgi:tetratricopeptide (TPR) repeat protein